MSLCGSILFKIGEFVSILFGVAAETASSGNVGGQLASADLFPKSLIFKTLKPSGETDVKQCSTNHQDFVLSEEHFIPSPISERSIHHHGEKGALNNVVSNDSTGFVSLSPVSSVKSNNSVNGCGQASSLSTISSVSHDDDDLGEEDESDNDTPESEKIHECGFCDAKFRIRGYLTRHMKKHSSQKAYHCPFHDSNSSNKCHATGGFSRRDTFKTHLKARHFKYPPGVKSSNRTGMIGWCGICGERSINNEIWVERHIEGGKCPGLPKSYLNRLNPGKKKTGKHSKFLDVQNVDQSLMLSTTESKDLLGKLVSPSATNTPSPNLSSFGGSNNSFEFAQQQQIQQQQQRILPITTQFLSSPLPTAVSSGMMNYNTNFQHAQQQIPVQMSVVPEPTYDSVDMDIDVLMKRKNMLEQYIQTLQRAAEAQKKIDFNSNCFRSVKGASEEDFPSLDSEYSSVGTPVSKSIGYPVNIISNYGISLEEN